MLRMDRAGGQDAAHHAVCPATGLLEQAVLWCVVVTMYSLFVHIMV